MERNEQFDTQPAQHPASDLKESEGDFEAIPSSAADVESAGRSCLAILLLLAVIVVLAGVWLLVWSSS